MVEIKQFGKVSDIEQTEFDNAAEDACKLCSGLKKFNGIVEKDAFITKIEQAETLIDNLVAFKTTLTGIKTTLQNA